MKQNEAGRAEALSCLQHAIADTQGTIRAFDMKANVLGIFLTVALGITNFAVRQSPTPISKFFVLVSWILGLAALAVLGLVLYPHKSTLNERQLGDYVPSATYFLHDVHAAHDKDVDARAAHALATDWVSELTYIHMKLSLIRDFKHAKFIQAMQLTAATLVASGFASLSFVWYW